MKNLLFLLFPLFSAFSMSAQEPYVVVPKHYGLIVTVDYDNDKLNGMCEITLTNEGLQSVDSVSFLLYRLMKITGVSDIEDQPLQYTQHITEFDDFGKLQINQIYVQKTLNPGESTTIKLSYSGYLLGYAETGMKYIKDKISPKFTFIRFDSYAYPYPCLPNFDMLRLSASRKFDYSLTINIPDSLAAICGGECVAHIVENGMATYEYNSKLPVWRIDIAIADYKKISGTFNTFYFSDEDAAQQIANKGNKCFQLYQQWWGELKAYKGLTIIETEEGSGGQTDETTILLPSEAFSDKSNYEYLFHELSHLWNVPIREEKGVSPRWEEGLATFCQSLASEKLNDESFGYTKEKMNRNIRELNTQLSRNQQLKNTPLVEYGNKNMTGLSYTHGAIIFAILYYWLEEETFNNLIGGFYQQHYSITSSTRMFTNYCIKHGKRKQLETFFDDWIYTTGYSKHLTEDTTIDDIVAIYRGK